MRPTNISSQRSPGELANCTSIVLNATIDDLGNFGRGSNLQSWTNITFVVGP